MNFNHKNRFSSLLLFLVYFCPTLNASVFLQPEDFSEVDFEQVTSSSEYSRFMQNDDHLCNTVNNFPVFYGGVQNNFVKGLNVSPDQNRIVMCGESYSYQNFVDRPIQGYVMVVDAQSGEMIWGKYYQGPVKNSTQQYIGLFYSCKFVTDQKIIVSGQVNFYRPFIGVIDATDGKLTQSYVFESSGINQTVGYSSYALEMDNSGNLYAGINFMRAAITIVKVRPGSSATAPATFSWANQIGSDSIYSSGSPPTMCLEPNQQQNLFIGTSVVYNDGIESKSVAAFVSLSANNGEQIFFKRDLSIEGVNVINCLSEHMGVIGCGNRAATSYIFRVRETGEMLFNYVFTGDNPEHCTGLIVQREVMYVLLETQSSSYTRTGYMDSVIMQLDINGRPRMGKYFSLSSKQTLAKGLYLMTDGSLVYAGATKKALYHNYQYNAIFLNRVNLVTGEKCCLQWVSVPDPTAISFKDDMSQYGEANDSILNSLLQVVPNEYVTLNITVTPDKLIANKFKAPVPYKQFQTCFVQVYQNPWEKIVNNKTEVNIVQPHLEAVVDGGIMVYYLGEVNQVRKIEHWLYDALKDQRDLKVSMADNSPLPNFIKVADGQVSVYSNSTADIGLYAVQWAGCYQYKRASFFQGIEVRANTPPALNLTNGTNTMSGYTFVVGGSWQILIPQIIDKEFNSEFLMTISNSPMTRKTTKLPYFMNYDPMTQIINLNPQSMVDVGAYNLYIRVSEIDAPSYLSTYTLSVKIVTLDGSLDPLSNTTGSGKRLLRGTLIEDQIMEGKIYIKFNQAIAVPPLSFDTIKEEEFIKLDIKGRSAPYEYTWSIESITKEGIMFDINFDTPNIIGLFNEHEVVNITFNRMLIHTQDKDDGKTPFTYLSNLEYLQELTVIIDSTDQSLSQLNNAATTIKAVLAAVMGASVVSQAAMSHAMQNLWAVINSLQLLSYMAFMHVNLTPHLFIVFNMLLSSHFDVIPLKDDITGWIFDAYENDDEEVTDEIKEPFNYNMGLFGYDTVLIYLNLVDGGLLIVMLFAIFVIMKILIKIPWRCQRIKNYLENNLKEFKYNAVIRTFLELYLDIALFSLVGFMRFRFEDTTKSFSTFFSLTLFPATIAIIPYGYIYLRKNMIHLRDKNSTFSEKMSTLVEGLSLDRPCAYNSVILFLARRIFFTLLFSIPKEQYLTQLSLNLVHCVAQIAYLVCVRPYIMKRTNFQETTNEVCILIVACLLFDLTDLEADYKVKMKISWVIIFIILGSVVFNLAILLYSVLLGMKKSFDEWRAKRAARKYEINTEMIDLKAKGWRDPSIKDFVIQDEEIKEGENPYSDGFKFPKGGMKLMKHYLPDEVDIYQENSKFQTHAGIPIGVPADQSDISYQMHTKTLDATEEHRLNSENIVEIKKKYKTKASPKKRSFKQKRNIAMQEDPYNLRKTHQQSNYADQDDHSRVLTTTPSNFNTLTNMDEDENSHVNLEDDGPNVTMNSRRVSKYQTVGKVTQSTEQLIQEELKNNNTAELLQQDEEQKFRKSEQSSGGSGSGQKPIMEGGSSSGSSLNVLIIQEAPSPPTLLSQDNPVLQTPPSDEPVNAQPDPQQINPIEDEASEEVERITDETPSKLIDEKEEEVKESKNNYYERTKRLRDLIEKGQ